MPLVYVYGFKRPIAKRRQIVREITDATCRAYDVPPEIVTVYLMDLARDSAAHAGELASDAIRRLDKAKKKPKTARKARTARPKR
ncbi:MAG: tautomerase family protein [Rhodospirillales bacterium]|jgi:4-oxalocrotonate tautomerase|nr:tautomerase family protein [Rhodospirillales bacterium]MDP6805152.1 tautomerase family protein [Rhodospirillales bacterium]